jgi:ParB family chromosome partitioning protein
MSENPPRVEMIAIDTITVINPRVRNKRVFNELITSIAHLGLKKPITVSRRAGKAGYDLVCGQGRLEAFRALGQAEIPAIVIEASEEDCYVMSLVENMARRQLSSVELMREIYALRERGYSLEAIAAKTDFSVSYVEAICTLFDDGEERLITAVDRGIIPYSIAIEIAHAKDGEIQEALADAYEKKSLPGNQLVAIRQIIQQRRAKGKATHSFGGQRSQSRKRVTAEILVRAYRKEVLRQKLLVKKATLTQSRLLFVVNALRRLLADEHFVTLLRAEAMHSLPRPLAERLAMPGV